jgi:hypothetical protein
MLARTRTARLAGRHLPAGQRRMVSHIYLGGLVALLCSCCSPAPTAAAITYTSRPSSIEPYAACPPPTLDYAQCLAIIAPGSVAHAPPAAMAAPVTAPMTSEASPACFVGEYEYCGSGAHHGLSPQDLQSAYRLPSMTAGSGQTVAIVDAYDDPNAQSDLNVYRSTYGLPPCEAGCFTKINQRGAEAYPEGNVEWGSEISLDLDMVSAACPKCHILLVEADNNNLENLGIAEDEAAATPGVTDISNSYFAVEKEMTAKGVEEYAGFYEQSVPVVAASGDAGYDNEHYKKPGCSNCSPNFPADLSSVIAVGGTYLHPEGTSGRGWEESVWFFSGSGCTADVSKPLWQPEKSCTMRSDNDIAAEASMSSPVSVYDTYGVIVPGWQDDGGTSASTPLAAGAISLESAGLRKEGLEGIYKHSGNWFDVTIGSNGGSECKEKYLCNGEVGYDGPTGMGGLDGGVAATPPAAITEPASSVATTTATLNAFVDPEASETTYYFQYGASPFYGQEVPLGGTKASGYTKGAAVSQALSGLKAGTRYHFRIVAKSAGGTTYGSDQTFSTAPELYLTKIGSKGTGEGKFEGPQGIGIDAHNDVWVADYLNNRIEEFSPGGTFLRACGSKGAGAGQFNGPVDIAVNPTSNYARGGYIYVSDSGNNRIEVLSPSCVYAESIGSGGSENGELSSPAGLAFGLRPVNGRDVLAVADSGNNRVEEFAWETENAQTKAGEFVAAYGSKGAGAGQFMDPTGIILAGAGKVANSDDFYVVDSGNSRVQEFSETGLAYGEKVAFEYLLQFGAKGTENGKFTNPTAITLDPTTGDLDVTDSGSGRVQTFLANGTYVAKFGAVGTGGEDFESPKGIVANAGGELYVADSGNNRVDLWGPSQVANSEWHLTLTPSPAETENSYLDGGVACSSFSACTAVGEYDKTGGAGTRLSLAERWNGAEWTVQTTPNPTGAKSTYLRGVDCAVVNACTTTGYYLTAAGVYTAVAEGWNGSEWKVQSTPEPAGTLGTILYGVSCSSAAACTAVGWYENSAGVELPWAERWNGSTWSLQSMPAPSGAKASYPYAVSCVSATSCTAAGYYKNSSNIDVPFGEHWNGTEWSLQTMPTPSGSSKTEVSAISCSSATACTAAGEYENSVSVEVPFAERWNGTAWSVQAMPEPGGTKDSYLRGVSCASATACTAVGYYVNSAGNEVTLAESWNGSEWHVQLPPNPSGSTYSYLNGGVSCTSPTECAAVGYAKGLALAEIYG